MAQTPNRSRTLRESAICYVNLQRAGEADYGRQSSLRRREAVGVVLDVVSGGVGVDHGVGGGVDDDADVARCGGGAVGAGEEDQIAGACLAGGDLPPVSPLGLAGARDGQAGIVVNP